MKTLTYTALITPFKNNKIDENALEKIIENQISNGVDGIVPCGTTGECPTLSHKEHLLVIEISTKIVNKRIKVMAGTGSNCTNEAIEMTNQAKKLNVDSCLIVSPYYNKPTQHGMFLHFQELNKCDIPLVIYNIPGRSVVNINDETLAKIAELKNVIGIKDATGDLARLANLRTLIKKEFLYLSGEDATAVGFNAMGGNGVISVTSNIAPKLVSDLQKLCQKQDYQNALKIQDQLTNLHNAMFTETNPIPVKYAMSLLGLSSDEIRLPLCHPSEANKERIKTEMKKLKLI
jgi:4-hydroxy-tetrahydrodipicolinate synthase